MSEFDKFASDYRQIHTESIKQMSGTDSEYFCRYKIEEVHRRFPRAKRILDYGCGDGCSAEYFRELYPDAEYVGIDVSEESIRAAKARTLSNTSFAVFDGFNSGLESGSFDLVFAACVFHHIEPPNRSRALKECTRLLSQQGKLFIFEHNPVNIFTLKLVADCPFDEGVKLIAPQKLKKMADTEGLKNTRLRYTIFMPRKQAFSKLLWIENHLYWNPIGAQYFMEAEK